MSALGIWLWSNPQSFGAPDSKDCAVQFAKLSILGAYVRFGSQPLRISSLVIYSTFLLPGFNPLLPVLSILYLYEYPFRVRLSRLLKTTARSGSHSHKLGDCPHESRWNGVRSVLPVFIGLAFLLAMNAILIADIELTLQRNRHIQTPGESEWGFGQTLAILVAVIPTLWDFSEALSRKRKEAQRAADDHLQGHINVSDLARIVEVIKAGADPNVRANGWCPALILWSVLTQTM
jgi:hypothetical protein